MSTPALTPLPEAAFTPEELRGRDTVALVACVQTKADHALPAAYLYTSDWFVWAREIVERNGWPWRILSAAHGLLHPERVIAPYQQTLVGQRRDVREAWARRVLADLATVASTRVVILAGAVYREHLVASLAQRGCTIEVPMAGMGIGYQRQWLRQQCAALRAQR